MSLRCAPASPLRVYRALSNLSSGWPLRRFRYSVDGRRHILTLSLQSQAIKTPFAIFCSGQIPCDKTGKLTEGTIQDKAAQCIKNLQAVLVAADSSLAKVVKVNIFLADMAEFAVSCVPGSFSFAFDSIFGNKPDS